MKSFKFITIVALAFLLLIGGMFGTASAATWRNMTVYNNTGYTIYRLYIAPKYNTSWGNDLLGNNTLGNGGYVNIRYDANSQYYDIKIVLTDNSERVWKDSHSLNFAGSTMLFFTYLGNGRFNARVD